MFDAEVMERVDDSQQSLIANMAANSTFVVPTVVSFAMGELSENDTRTWTYAANT